MEWSQLRKRGWKSLTAPWARVAFIGLVVALSSQLYLLPGVEEFRISASVALYPVLLLTLVPELRPPVAGAATAGTVFLLRALLAWAGGEGVAGAVDALPGALFYLYYECLFRWILRNRPDAGGVRLWCGAFLADLLSNLAEVGLSTGLNYQQQKVSFYLALAGVALARSLCAVGLWSWLGYYRRLLLLTEHESRYRRLFLMTARLKDELFFLNKTTEEIEGVMGKAYRLYEELERDTAEDRADARRLALELARDVHEVKKDHLRVLRGIEGEVEAVYDRENMRFSHLMKILEESTRRTLGRTKEDSREKRIHLSVGVGYDFFTREHYRLLSILRNLVQNAMEAMQREGMGGTIRVEERREGDALVFLVEDEGPGVPQRLRDRVFHMGFSTKFSPQTGDINRGVGLPAVKSLTEEFGGQVTLEEGARRGCRFVVRLPRAALEEETDANLPR